MLYGIFPVMLGGAGIQWLYMRYKLSNARKFEDVPPEVKLKKVHSFEGPSDVELIARAMRVFDIEGAVLEDAAVIGERIIKVSGCFDNHVTLSELCGLRAGSHGAWKG